MNAGIISSRYARALLVTTREKGCSERACDQVRQILKDPDHIPQPLEDEILGLISLLRKNGRLDYLKEILHAFLDLYCRAEGIVRAHLVTVVPDGSLEENVREVLSEGGRRKVYLESKTDPSLIGGFTLEVDGRLLDASVNRQLEMLRSSFVDKVTRIV